MPDKRKTPPKAVGRKASVKKAPAPRKPQKKDTSASKNNGSKKTEKQDFPKRFPFWARLKISKNRTTLVIDEEPVVNKKTKKKEDGFVHREATHSKRKDYEEIMPNPDKEDPDPMYLKRPRKHPKRMFAPHNKHLDMPEWLKERYEKNNAKGVDDEEQ